MRLRSHWQLSVFLLFRLQLILPVLSLVATVCVRRFEHAWRDATFTYLAIRSPAIGPSSWPTGCRSTEAMMRTRRVLKQKPVISSKALATELKRCTSVAVVGQMRVQYTTMAGSMPVCYIPRVRTPHLFTTTNNKLSIQPSSLRHSAKLRGRHQ